MSRAVIEPAAFRAALEFVGGVLDRAGVVWWIQDGTLLGAIREGGPIPGDKDIDLGVFARTFRPSLLQDLAAAGLAISRARGPDHRHRLLVRVHHRGVQIDIFGMYEEGDRWSYSIAHHGLRIDNVFTPFGIGRTTFMGLAVPCPDPPERYLLEAYGPAWRIPNSEWHCAFSPFNLRVHGGPLAHLYYRHRRWKWRRRIGREISARAVPQTGSA
jgi:hypothetical protein